jgi:hypothetical protein
MIRSVLDNFVWLVAELERFASMSFLPAWLAF